MEGRFQILLFPCIVEYSPALMTQFRALTRKFEEVDMQHLWFFFCFLHLGHMTDLDQKCGENRLVNMKLIKFDN